MKKPFNQKLILPTLFLFLLSTSAFSQKILLNGNIRDNYGEPVNSAFIKKKGTNLATISNSNGDFNIYVSPADSILIFSKNGFLDNEVNVFQNPKLQIELIRIEKDYFNSDEFQTVGGFGKWKDINNSNSVSHLLLEKYHNSSKSLLDILELMPGITIRSESGQPGSNVNVWIRGNESVISNQPLIIMDGIVLNSGINMPDISPEISVLSAINIKDVKRVEVIKDGGATAVFGSLGGNGVILIETNKGEKNSFEIKNHTQFGVDFPIGGNNMMEPIPYFELINESLSASSMEQINFPENPGYMQWENEILRPGFSTNNTLVLQGGGEKSQFYISGNLNYNKGVIKNSSLTSGGIRANFSTSLAQWLDIAFHGVYSESYQKSPVHVENQIHSNPYFYSKLYPPISKGEIKSIPALSTPFGQIDPKELIYKVDPQNRASFMIVGLDFTVKLSDHFSFNSKISGDYSYYKKGSSVFNPEYSYLNELHRTQKSTLNNWELSNFLKFQKLQGKSNWLFILGSSELMLNVNHTINSNFIGGFNQPENWIENLDGENTRRLSAQFTKIQYAYNEYFDLSASFRREKVSNQDGDDLFGIFPSFSTGFWLKKSKEKKEEIFSAMKLFFTWGVPGSNQFFPINNLNYSANNQYSEYIKYANIPKFNPNSKWELTNEWNMGFQSNWFDNDLIFKVTYFDRFRKNVAFLTTEYIDNFEFDQWNYSGSVYNTGYELEFNYNKNYNEFGIFAGADMQINSSKVFSLGELNSGKTGHYPDYIKAGTPLAIFKEGNAPGSFWGYINEGVVQGDNEISGNLQLPGDYRFADLDENGIINENDKTVIGNPNPDFTYSINGGIIFEDFDFTFVVDGSSGGDIYNIEKTITESSGGYNNRSVDMLNRWTESNPSGVLSRVVMNDPNNNSSLHSGMIESGSFFRLNRIEFGYDFNFIGKNRNRAYIAGYDLITIYKYSGGAPYFSGINNNRGVGFGISPFSSSILIGLQIGI